MLRFDFPYMEAGRKAPDRAPVLVEATRRAFDLAVARAGGLPVLAGGRSMGGRIASMATAEGMPAAGLVFLAYPLHPPGRPEKIRDAHLYGIEVPMLFLQGTGIRSRSRSCWPRCSAGSAHEPSTGRSRAATTPSGWPAASAMRARIGTSLAPFAAEFVERRVLRSRR